MQIRHIFILSKQTRGFIMQHSHKENILTGVNARKTAGYPEALKEIMLFLSWEMGIIISTRVGNPPRIDIPVKESTKAANIKTKTAPSSKTKEDLYLVSPARGTIIVDQEIFGKTGSARIPEGQGYNHVPYPTTLRELFKFVEQGMLEVKRVGDEIHFEALGDFKPVAKGYYDHDKLKFTESSSPPSLTYCIKLSELSQQEISGISPVLLTEEEKKKLSPWRDSNELSSQSAAFLNENGVDSQALDKPVPLYYRHGNKAEFKVLNVVAKDNAIVIGDDDTLSMSPSLALLDFIKRQQPNNPHIVHELMDTLGNFNDKPEETAKRLYTIEKLLCEFNIERLTALGRQGEAADWKAKLEKLMNRENPEKYYMDMYYKDGKFAGIDSCGNDGMSAFELMISIKVNEQFHEKLHHIGQFIQHPPEIRNHTVPSSLEDKAMHIWNGQFVLTQDENGLIAFYTQQNEGKSYAEKFPLLAEHFVEVSPIWLTREYKNDKNEVVSVGADKWWPVIAIQMALGQQDYMDKATLQAYSAYVQSKPELSKLDTQGRAELAEKQLAEHAKIPELSDLINPNKPPAAPRPAAATFKSKVVNTAHTGLLAAKKLFFKRVSPDLLLLQGKKGNRLASNDKKAPSLNDKVSSYRFKR